MHQFKIIIILFSLLGLTFGAFSRGPQYNQIDDNTNDISSNSNSNSKQIDAEEEPSFVESTRPLGRCIGGNDCQNLTECSVMGMQRYSEPRCQPLGGLGSPCRMYSEPEDKELNFPHVTLLCESVYMQFCPCNHNLICHEAQCLTPSMVDELKRKARRDRAREVMASSGRWARIY